MSKDHEVRVDGGKFTFIAPSDHPTVRVIDRIEPEPWVYYVDRALPVTAMMRELDAARVVVQAVRDSEKAFVPGPIVEALLRHDALTSDREPPSAWCGAEYAERHAGPAFTSPGKTLRCECGSEHFYNRSGNGRPNVYVCVRCETEHSWTAPRDLTP